MESQLKPIKFVFLRVSKKDLKSGSDDEKIQQDYETQLPSIVNKFKLNLEDCIVVKEKGTAYNNDKIKARIGFLEIIKEIIGDITLMDFFLGNCEKKNIRIYSFDWNRYFRSIEYGLLFSIICVFFNVKIYSVNQEDLNPKIKEEIGEKIGRYIRIAMYSFLAEGYSKNVSDATKKTVRKDSKKVTESYKGNKWGRWFSFTDGSKKPLDIDEANKLYNYIKLKILYYERNNMKYYYPLIKEKVEKKFNIIISGSYLTKVKKEVLQK